MGKYEGRWLNTISGDGFGYYAYLNAVFLPSGFEYDMEKDGLNYGKYPVHPYDLLPFDTDSTRFTKYFPGTALLISPFYLTALVISQVTEYDTDGFSIPFQYSVLLSAIFYLLVALYFLRALLKTYSLSENQIILILLPTAIGTNLINYVWNEPSYSHLYVFFAVSGFLLFLRKFTLSNNSKHLIVAVTFFGLGIIVRPTSALVFLAIPLITESKERFGLFIQTLFNQKFRLLASALILTMFAFLYLFTNYLQFEEWRLWTYTGESFDFLHPNFQAFLFSYKKGLFVYTPYLLLLIPAFVALFKGSKFIAYSFLLFFLTIIFVLSSWWAWSYGGSFGSRSFIDFLPVVVLFIGIYFSHSSFQKPHYWLIAIFSLLAISLNLIQNYQYSRSIIDYDNMDDEKYWQVFLKTDDLFRWVTAPPADYLKNRKIIQVKSWQNDFDRKQDWKGDFNTVSWPITSPHKDYGTSVLVDRAHPYAAPFNLNAQTLRNDSFDLVAEWSFSTLLASSWCDGKAVVSVKNENHPRWTGEKIISQARRKGIWYFVKFQYNLKSLGPDDQELGLYILHEHDKPIWVDNLNFRLYYLEKRD